MGGRTIPGDWHAGVVPDNVVVDDGAHIETTYSFLLYRSARPVGVRLGAGASTYVGTMFDVGPRGRVTIGRHTLVNGVWIICDDAVEIGDSCLLSWNIVIMDSYRVPLDPDARRRMLERRDADGGPRRVEATEPARPVRIGPNAWIGFGASILPGVTIGEGAVVGACSVVAADVPPFTVAAGNPARVVRTLERGAA